MAARRSVNVIYLAIVVSFVFCFSLFSRRSIPSDGRFSVNHVVQDLQRDDSQIIYEYGFENGWEEWTPEDPWEISNEDAHRGEQSAHCPIAADLEAELTAPELLIPEQGYTYFDFWVRADTRVYDGDGDNLLDDYFQIHVRLAHDDWEPMIYDYGRNDEWRFNWIHYVPGTWFRHDLPEWRVMLNLTQFAGQYVQLRWRFRTDDVMHGNQGTGLWIDDFRLINVEGYQDDVGVEWTNIHYPATLGTDTRGEVAIKNYGFAYQNVVQAFSEVHGRVSPLMPWGEIGPGETRISAMRIRGDHQYQYSGNSTVKTYTALEDDENRENDTLETDIFVFPEGLWELGYDNRHPDDSFGFGEGGGSAVLFEPVDLGVEGDFTIEAIHTLWSGAGQNEPETVRFHILVDENEGFFRTLYMADVEIPAMNNRSYSHYLELPDQENLRNFHSDFWILITHPDNNRQPQILGHRYANNESYYGENHFYQYRPDNLQEVRSDFQIHAIIVDSENDQPSLAVQPVFDLGVVPLNYPARTDLIVSNAGIPAIEIEGINIDNGIYSYDVPDGFPITVRTGEKKSIPIILEPENVGIQAANLSFDCNQDDPPEVRLRAIASDIPNLVIDHEQINFGMVAENDLVEVAFSIANDGYGDLIISDMFVVGEYFGVDFDLEIIVAPGDEEDVIIVFFPGRIGEFDGELTIDSNDPDRNRLNIPLHGIGADPRNKPEESKTPIPNKSGISAVHPNPFNSNVTIEYSMSGNEAVDLSIIDINGRLVKRLSAGMANDRVTGGRRATWNGTNASNEKTASGMYFVRMIVGEEISLAKALYIE